MKTFKQINNFKRKTNQKKGNKNIMQIKPPRKKNI